MSARNAAGSGVFIDDPDAQAVLAVAPRSLREGAAPRLLDEWQVAPELWNLVRRAVDSTAGMGQFILTGSAVPADDSTRHPGAGRFLRLRQRTMSWWEKLDRPPRTVSLAALFSGDVPPNDLDAAPTLDIEAKLGGRQLLAGRDSLNAVISQVDTSAMDDPAFRLVVKGTGPVLASDDGTISAPLAAPAP